MSEVDFFKCLADQTRLKLLSLLINEKELCVCELTYALDLSQPKISRHMALLREEGLLTHRKVGKWVYYQLTAELVDWKKQIIYLAHENMKAEWENAILRLNAMSGRPNRASLCCDK